MKVFCSVMYYVNAKSFFKYNSVITLILFNDYLKLLL
jgi:hypothetical protein